MSLKGKSNFQKRLADFLAGKVSCEKVVGNFLSTINANKHLNAYVEVYEEEAKQKASILDSKPKEQLGKFAGMVVGIKDLICYKGHAVQASSKILDGFVSHISATVVDRLLENDAIIIGRQNCDEFGMGSSNENSIFGPVLNNFDHSKSPGGSSGGGAVAVQANMCDVSIGTDTGGSVRQPAAFCGIVGLRPTYSRVSRYGLIEHASSFDTIGIMANNVVDCANVLSKIAGKDQFDNTVSSRAVPDYENLLSVNSKFKIAYIADALEYKNLQPEVRANTFNVINKLKAEGHSVHAIRFDLLDYLLPTYYVLTSAEASSNLSRYDGVRFGYRSNDSLDVESMYLNSRSAGFGKEVKKRILLGNFILSSDYYDSYYTKAQKVRMLIKEKTDALFSNYDFLILPTTPSTAFPLYKERDSVDVYLEDLYTVYAALVGLPAISIPNGTDADNMPVGLQIMSAAFTEDRLLAFANYLFNAA
jgi:aspartyl-tRNA(Asn)/glutamyl-tRNA(Gln) amidotransferase subunit A